MNTTDRGTLAAELDQELDGQLGAAGRKRLARRLDTDAELAAERRRLMALHGLLREDRIAVRDGFQESVMASLPAPAWRPGRLPAWAVPLVMTLVLGVAAAWMLGTGSGPAEGPAAGTGLALFDFLKVTALAGAGLVAASWRGLGLGLEELIATSGLSLAAMAILVLFLDLLFISMLRRRAHDVQPILESAAVDAAADADDRRGE